MRRVFWHIRGRGGEYFPSFPERLSLRHLLHPVSLMHILRFPFLSGRAFIEAAAISQADLMNDLFPILFGRAFIEALATSRTLQRMRSFPYSFVGTFSEVLCRLHHGRISRLFPYLVVGIFKKTDCCDGPG